jgi:hypothetical protein
MARQGSKGTTLPDDTHAALSELAVEFGGTKPLTIPATIDKLIAEHKQRKATEITG